jgi:RNA polymerase sigma factor (TIGR02999 family)
VTAEMRGSTLWTMSDVTGILSQIESGDPSAAEQLLPLVYEELRKLAAAKIAQEKPGQTLQATALVHEAYLRLMSGGQKSEVRSQKSEANERTSDLGPLTSGEWNSRGHFFAAAAEAMRRILVEQYRRKQQVKHGGDFQRLPLDGLTAEADDRSADVLALDESLARLEAHDSLAASVVKLRYFAGLSMPETAESLGIPLRTAERNWTYARTWLLRELA